MCVGIGLKSKSNSKSLTAFHCREELGFLCPIFFVQEFMAANQGNIGGSAFTTPLPQGRGEREEEAHAAPSAWKREAGEDNVVAHTLLKAHTAGDLPEAETSSGDCRRGTPSTPDRGAQAAAGGKRGHACSPPHG